MGTLAQDTGANAGCVRAMVLSVGGSPGPIVASLNAQEPELVCFFVSTESRGSLDTDILPRLTYRPRHYDWIETPSAEDLLACYRVLAQALPRLADKWKAPLGEFVADYTGGTKTMSVALALATVQAVGRYTYVGGFERTKDGLGVVIDGKERMLHQTNPWDALAVTARQRASLLFSRGRYEAAAEEFETVADRVSPAEHGIYQGLAALARGYAEWDRFNHSRAQALLSQSLRTLEPFAIGSGDITWTDLLTRVRRHVKLLRAMEKGGSEEIKVADLIANARRRGDLEARYDDAVARLYSALEMAARIRLATVHRINTSRTEPLQVPEPLREESFQRYVIGDGEHKGKLKLPQFAAFRLLAELKDELGIRYFSREKEIGVLLNSRNKSILGHGEQPANEDLYRRFFGLTCEVAGVREEDLPVFPRLPG